MTYRLNYMASDGRKMSVDIDASTVSVTPTGVLVMMTTAAGDREVPQRVMAPGTWHSCVLQDETISDESKLADAGAP